MRIDLSIFNPSNRPLIGLDISSSAVKMVELSGDDKGGYRVERYAIEALPRDSVVDGKVVNIEAISESITRAWKRMGATTRFVAMALPGAAVITKKIILPANLREQEMEMQVESEANQYIPFALEEVNLDFQMIGPAPSSPDEVEVMIAASRKEMVEDRVACAEAAEPGLKPLVMDVETYAALSAFELIEKRLPESGRDQIIALVDIGANVTNVTVLRNDQTVYTREQAFGGGLLTQDIMRAYGMSPEEAEGAKRSGSLPDNYQAEILGPFCENLAQEIARAIQFFFSSSQFTQVDHIVLSGGCAVIPGVSDVVMEHTQINTIVANAFEGMSVAARVRAKALESDAPTLLVACGLALRRFDK